MVWCNPGVGLLVVVPPLPPCGMVWVRVFLRWLPAASLGLLWVFVILTLMMIMMMTGTMITIFIINSNILMLLWLVVGCLLPTCLVTIIAFFDRRATIFVTVVALGPIAMVAMGQLSQGSGLSGNVVRQLPCLRPSCQSRFSLGSVHSHKDRACLGCDPRDS